MAVVTLTSDNFEKEVLMSDKPVLVDFWAAWCGPCRMVSPLVDEVSEEISYVKVGKVNVDEEGALAEQFGIDAIPALLVFKDGKLAAKEVGYIPKDEIIALISE